MCVGRGWLLRADPPLHLGLCLTLPATFLLPCTGGQYVDREGGFGPQDTPEGRLRHAAVPGKASEEPSGPAPPCHMVSQAEQRGRPAWGPQPSFSQCVRQQPC